MSDNAPMLSHSSHPWSNQQGARMKFPLASMKEKKDERITIRISSEMLARLVTGQKAAGEWSLSAYVTGIVESNAPALAPVAPVVAPVAPVAAPVAPASVVVFKTKAKPKAKPKAKAKAKAKK